MSKQKRLTPLANHAVPAGSCTTERRLELLSRVPLFGLLEPQQLEEVNSRFRAHDYQTGATVHRAGDPAQHLYVVATGVVKLLRYGAEGQEVLLDILAPGDFFGSLAVLGDEVYQDTAVTQTPCCILVLPAPDFEEMLSTFPAVTRAALELTTARLKQAQEAIQQLSALTLEQRLAATLLKLAEKVGEAQEGSILLQLPLTQQDLAAMTGSTAETVNRALRRFRKLGLVRSGRRWFILTDPRGLAHFAET